MGSFPSKLIKGSPRKKNSPKNTLCTLLALQDWQKATALISSSPSSLSTISPSDGQSSPLHVLVSYDCPVSLVEQFIALYPEALKKRGYQGFLPLHVACHKKPETGFFRSVGELKKGTLEEFSTPEYRVKIVSTLVNAFPQSVQIKNRFGEYPFTRAFMSNNYAVLDYLITTWPDCLTEEAGKGLQVSKVLSRRKKSEWMFMMSLAFKVEMASNGRKGSSFTQLWDENMSEETKYVYWIFKMLSNYKTGSAKYDSIEYGRIGYHDCHGVIMSFVGVEIDLV